MNILKRLRDNLLLSRVLSSLAYRTLLLVFGIIVLWRYDNILPIWVYGSIIPIYVIGFFEFLTSKWRYARIVLDFLFIAVVLYGKFPLSNLCLIYALYPLISSTIYTGEHRKYWPILIVTLIFLFALEQTVNKEHWLAAFIIWLAGYQSWQNRKMNNLVTTITAHIDNYFADNDGTQRPHHIYANIIKEINSFLGFDYLLDIYSYTLKEPNMLWLVNSSKFTYSRTLELDKKVLEPLVEENHYFDKEARTHYYLVEQSGVKYVYRCVLSLAVASVSVRREYVINYVLDVTFGRLSGLLASEFRIAEKRRSMFEETKGHIDYVTRALKVVHFIRNKLTPIKSVITFYKSCDKMSAEVRAKMEERIKKEVSQAGSDLDEIVKTANYLLDKQNNPYSGADIEDINIKLLFVILSEIVEHHLGGTVRVGREIIDDTARRTTPVSLIQLKVMFTDIVSNIEKCYYTYYDIEMRVVDDRLIIVFANDYPANLESDCISTVRDINNSNNEGIVQRKSHGISNIKSAASIMNIDLFANNSVSGGVHQYSLTTKFKLHENNKDTDS